MVFESLVVDLVNKYLGDFVENLDKSQLKIGIWGGDVVLDNLDLKESALDDLDLPVRILAGHLGKLTLKIPWKNLYKEPVVASIEGLYALAVPNQSIKYDAEKEEKAAQEKKQKALQRIEDLKQAELEKDKPKKEKNDSFAEKLATQVVKNLQVNIKNIHVRYEDKYTNPEDPFAIGVSLEELNFQTCDTNWKPAVIKETVIEIYKLISLKSLSVYWNAKSKCLSEMNNKQQIYAAMGRGIGTQEQKTGYQYLVKPINSRAHLKLNTHPERTAFTIPKVLLELVMEEIAVALSKAQYDNVLEMLESFDRMILSDKYRKYRPNLQKVKGNSKEWWHFAYKCITEEVVKRRHKMWSWRHIKYHRQLLRTYKESYKKKLTSKKIAGELKETLKACEKELDVFNITLMRQQAELEVKIAGLQKSKEDKKGGWFGGWFGGGSKKKKEEQADKGVEEKFYELMTPEEKSKLYDAIGYQENAADPTLPKEFEAIKLNFLLKNLSLTLHNPNKSQPQLLNIHLENVTANVGQRPSANAITVTSQLQQLSMFGAVQNGKAPQIFTSLNTTADIDGNSLVTVLFQTNPLDGKCDTRVDITSKPVEIAYDAVTINQIVGFFQPPESVYLKQLSAAAMSKFEEIKEQSATGLQHIIEERKFTDININLQPARVVVPQKGVYTSDANLLVLSLGELTVQSEKTPDTDLSGKVDSLENMMLKAYDKFNISLKNVQLVFSEPGDDWLACCNSGKATHLHILKPMGLNIGIHKSMVDDVRMPKLKVQGELPSLNVHMSDYRLKQLLSLALSIPLPETPPTAELPSEIEMAPETPEMESRVDVKSIVAIGEDTKPPLQKQTSTENLNMTDLELKFVLKEVNLNISQRRDDQDIPLLRLMVKGIGTEVKIRTFDMVVDAYLGGIYLQHLQLKAIPALQSGPLVNIINTPSEDDQESRLLSVQYVKANKKGPDFATTYNNTEQKIDVKFTALEVLLHQQALLNIMQFVQGLDLEKELQSVTPPAADTQAKKQETVVKEEKDQDKKVSTKPRKKVTEIIDVQVNANMDTFALGVCTEEQFITEVKVKGLQAGVSVCKSKTDVHTVLKDITVFDPIKDAVYPKIVSTVGSEVFKMNVVVYNGATEGDEYSNMEAVDTEVHLALGGIKAVFLMRYVNDLLRFLDSFQAAKDKIAEASEAAMEQAKEAAQNLYQKAPRVILDISMKAPIIYIPQSSKSTNIFLVDMGLLQLANNFKLAGKTNEAGVPAVLDTMTIELSQLKLSRAVLNAKGEDIVSECLLLQPLNIGLKIQRNLAAGWYRDLPEVDIAGKLEAVEVGLSQGDFTVLMLMLNENMAEGTPAPPAVQEAAQATAVAEASNEPETTPKPATTTVETVPAEADVYSKMKFSFEVQSIGAALYKGESEMTERINERKMVTALALFQLKLIAVRGEMKTDNSMVAGVVLADIMLEDTRQPKKESAITRMIERVGGSTGKHLIDVNFTQDSKLNKKIDVSVNSLHICVCVEYLMAIGDFFVKGMPQAPPPPPKPKAVVRKDGSKVAPAPPPEPPEAELSLVLKVVNPEIVLVEDAGNKDTNAVIMKTEVSFSMDITPEHQQMKGSVENISIIACKFAQEKRARTTVHILSPCDINLHGKAPFGHGHHIDIMVSDIILNISPATIRLLSAVSAAMAAQQSEEEKQIEKKAPEDLWIVKNLKNSNYWFLRTETGEEVETQLMAEEELMAPVEDRGEQLVLSVPSVVVKVEGGVGRRTIPLLMLESAFQGQVQNWSSKLHVDGSLTVEVAYYNERLAVWEPLLEPVEDVGKHRPWEIGLVVDQNEELPDISPEDESDVDVVRLPPPKMTIAVTSTDMMQLTLSKSCLEMLTNLGKAFNDAYMLIEPDVKPGEVHAPYVFRNESGLAVLMKLDQSLEPPPTIQDGHIKLAPGDVLPLNIAKTNKKPPKRSTSIIQKAQRSDEKKFAFIVEEFGATRQLNVTRAEKRSYDINQVSYPGDIWAMVADIEADIGCRTITFRSMVQVKNHFSVVMEVWCQGLDENSDIEKIGEVAPQSTYCVPLDYVYNEPNQLFFKPKDEKYKPSQTPMSWKNSQPSQLQTMVCNNTEPGYPDFCINVILDVEQVYYEDSMDKQPKCYTFNLHPTVVFHNLLPHEVAVTMEGDDAEVTVACGDNALLFTALIGATTMEVKLSNYLGKDWYARRSLDSYNDSLTSWPFEAYEGSTKHSLDLGLHIHFKQGHLELSLYSPYWMINKTGLPLQYKGSDGDVVIEHASDFEDAVLFSFSRSSKGLLKSKKDDKQTKKKSNSKEPWKKSGKASLKVCDSEFSDKFSLDTVGSSGTVTCKTKAKEGSTYEIGVYISLARSGLTKIVSFAPYYMVHNRAKETLQFAEATDNAEWFDAQPGVCEPFWPKQGGKKLQMKARVKGSTQETSPFLFSEEHTTLLKLDDPSGGINVFCQVTESAIVVTFEDYKPGMATVLLVNQSDIPVEYQQKETKAGETLAPQTSVLFTWPNPIGKRELVWKCGESKEQKDECVKDGIGDVFANADTKVFWVSFLDGAQRVLLFTQDVVIAAMAQEAGELERADQEIILSMQGLGLSLVNNYSRHEVAYLGITSSGIVWEEKRRRRFRALNLKQCKILEAAFQKYQMEIAAGKKVHSTQTLEGKLEVDFTENADGHYMMFKPNKRPIKRSFQEGIWLQYKTSPHSLQCHAKIQRLQLDNQVPACVFPTVLAPMPLPKSIAAESVPKPFTELSMMVRKHEHSSIMQIKYFKVLIQEMALKVDQTFLNAMIDMFTPEGGVEEDHGVEEMKDDMKVIKFKLADADVCQATAGGGKHFYDELHFSPIKIHISFSLQATGGDGSNKPTALRTNVISLFLQSVGIVLTDVQDVVFKLGYFERKHKLYNQSQLTNQLVRHYSGQAIKQMYVLVLGLDVLGNPFGVIRGLATGIEDLFYEPYQGAVQGPEEFAEGLALGVRSLFGHAVGGAAGAVSKITGTLGKGLAALTLDDEYQRKRREQMNKRPADWKEGVARGGKGLVMGVFDGVTGIVRKPVEGARQEGVEGFFKGLGKGLVGVVTRPTSGVIDFASSSFEGIRRIADMTDEVQRLRPPRFLQTDGIVRPFKLKEAEGNGILQDMEKGKYAKTDVYVAHIVVSKEGKNVLLVTNQRLIFVNRGDIFGQWDCEWQYTWAELREPPSVSSKGITVPLREKQKKSFPFSLGSSKTEKVVPLSDQERAKWIVGQIRDAIARWK